MSRAPLAAAAAALGFACAASPPKPAAPPIDYPGVLVPPSTVPGDFLRVQKLEVRFGGESHSLEAALQKKGDDLLLVALSPFGTRLFTLEQRDLEVKFASYLPMELPFPPRFILYTVERVYFRGLPGAPLGDGEHLGEAGGEQLREVWRDGRLLERDFSRPDRRGVIAVNYKPGMAGGLSPPLIEIDDGWAGYRLTITTVSEQKL